MTVEVMTQDDIQAMLKLDDTNIREVVRMSSFPAPAIDLSQKARRWLRSSVEQWVVDQYEKNKRQRVQDAVDYLNHKYNQNMFTTLPTKVRTE